MNRLRLLVFLFPVALLPGADPLTEVFARMDQSSRNFKGMTADIQETIYTQVVDQKNVLTGSIRLKRVKPGDVRFLVEFTQPDVKSVAFAGTEVRTYKPKENVEQIIDVASHKEALEQALLLGFGASSSEIKATYDVAYVGAEAVAGQRAAEIKLTPKSKDLQAQIQEADLWISDALGVPVQQKFLYAHAGGNYSEFTYSNIKLTVPSNADLQLKPSKGVQVSKVGK